MPWLLVAAAFFTGMLLGRVITRIVISKKTLCGELKIGDPLELSITDSGPLSREAKYIILKVDYGEDRK